MAGLRTSTSWCFVSLEPLEPPAAATANHIAIFIFKVKMEAPHPPARDPARTQRSVWGRTAPTTESTCQECARGLHRSLGVAALG